MNILRRLFGPKRNPLILIDDFAATARQYAQNPRQRGSAEGRGMVSQLCRYGTLFSPEFASWNAALGLELRPHRKLWELGYILQTLAERDMLKPGRRGLGFAVGAERIPALLAARGCDVLATDLAADDERNVAWAQTGQWAGGTAGLFFREICDEETFRERVRFRAVDMNAIPDDLRDFDFTWSTCSFEHCGNLELGIRFMVEQMKCLRPGGIAVHTTEFNLTSNQDTWTEGGTSIFRLRDIVEMFDRLVREGHSVEPLDLRAWSHPLDDHVDMPKPSAPHYTEDQHLRLALGPYACTSIGIIVRKAE